MVQKTASKQTSAHVEEHDEVPTEVNEQSAQVSEDACCLVAEIDAILDEVTPDDPYPDEVAIAPAPFDPWGDLPDEPKPWDDKYWDNDQNEMDHDLLNADFAEWRKQAEQWHEVRGLDFNVAGFNRRRSAAHQMDSCVC